MKKKIMSLALALVMCFTLSVPAFAATRSSSTISISINSEQLKQEAERIDKMADSDLKVYFISTYDMSEADADSLVALRHTQVPHSQAPHSQLVRSSSTSFPSNPYDGQRYTASYAKISLPAVVTVTAVAGNIMEYCGVPYGWAVSAASTIVGHISDLTGVTWIQISITYVYGPNNDGYRMWNYGPWTYTYG